MSEHPLDAAASLTDLPIEPLIGTLRAALRNGRAAVLQAPPGAGKTTRVPLALLEEAWLGGRRIVMLEPRRVATLLGDAPVITSEGRSFPVETRYLALPPGERFEDRIVTAIGRALDEAEDSLLVFLPGVGEIRRVERLLGERALGAAIRVAP